VKEKIFWVGMGSEQGLGTTEKSLMKRLALISERFLRLALSREILINMNNFQNKATISHQWGGNAELGDVIL
jgi:hypothetical protein